MPEWMSLTHQEPIELVRGEAGRSGTRKAVSEADDGLRILSDAAAAAVVE
jgi:hypothetical protein